MAFIKQLDINGSLAENLNDTGDISLNEDILSGTTFLAEDIKEGEFENELNVDGALANEITDEGLISLLKGTLTGTTVLPKILDKSAIHYDLKANWDRQTYLIAEKGHLYIYKDAETAYINGKKVLYAGIKVGDGSSYLIDMPYVVYARDHDRLIDHIHNYAIHVGAVDRVNWNDKVSASVSEGNEELIFTK